VSFNISEDSSVIFSNTCSFFLYVIKSECAMQFLSYWLMIWDYVESLSLYHGISPL